MILSRYVKSFPSAQQPGYRLLFSTRTAACVLLPEETWVQLLQGTVPGDIAADLLAEGIVVRDQQQEHRQVLHYLDELNRLNPNLKVSIILGLECNFDCPYCYEGAMKGKFAMDQATADQVVLFIQSRLLPGKKRLILSFYGGETLLYTRMMKRICEPLKAFAREQGADFEVTIVTNGSLLTRKTVQELLPFGLQYAKVTVDGIAANHNLSRPFANGRPSFAVILRNLQDVADLIDIGIGGNYTAKTAQYFPPLLDEFLARGLTPEKFARVKFSPVMQVNDRFANLPSGSGCGSMDEPWLAADSLMIREAIIKRGYAFPHLQPSPCEVDVEDAFTIHYDGSLYKCPTLIGHEHYKAGDIWQGMADFSASHHLNHWQRQEQCRECVYLPLCFGGCRYVEFQRSGTMAAVDCQKQYFDKTLEAMLQQDMKYGMIGDQVRS